MIYSGGFTTLTPPVRDEDHQRGPSDAPVTLVEFGDYQCPYCADAYRVVQAVEEVMGDNLRFVFRNFPLCDIHPDAEPAAEAAEAAAGQGRFWEMHALLFKHQRMLAQGGLADIAAEAGLDMERFRRDMERHAFVERVRHDMRSGVASGVQGTPTFFINGVRYTESWRPEALLDALRSAT